MTTHIAPNRMPLPPPSAAGNGRGPAVRWAARTPDALAEAVGWGALGALSVALLALALLVPERIGTLLAAAGLAGLVVFRLAAMRGGWVSRGLPARGSRSTRDELTRDEDGAPGSSEWVQ